MAIEKLQEQLTAAKASIAKLESDKKLAEAKLARSAAVKKAGVQASEALIEHLATCTAESAALIIESLRPVSGGPRSRDPNSAPDALTPENFTTQLEG